MGDLRRYSTAEKDEGAGGPACYTQLEAMHVGSVGAQRKGMRHSVQDLVPGNLHKAAI